MVTVDRFNFEVFKMIPGTKIPVLKEPISSVSDADDACVEIPKGIVIVDVDLGHDDPIVNKLYEYYKDKTHWVRTNRGYHFYFSLEDTSHLSSRIGGDMFKPHINALCGIMVDYKKNIPSFYPKGKTSNREFAVIKTNGIDRVSGTNYIMPLPYELYPISSKSATQNDLFNTQSIGEGSRSSAFVSILGSLCGYTNNYFTQDQNIAISNTIHFINEVLIDDPLPSSEINTNILSNLSKYKKSTDKSKATFSLGSSSQKENIILNVLDENDKYTKTSEDIQYLESTGPIEIVTSAIAKDFCGYIYQGDLYLKDPDVNIVRFKCYEDPVDFAKLLIEKYKLVVNKESKVKDLIFAVKARFPSIGIDHVQHVIFKNGWVLDQVTGEIRRYQGEFSTIIINTDYVDNVKQKLLRSGSSDISYVYEMDNFLNFISDSPVDSYKDTIQQEEDRSSVYHSIKIMLGHILMTHTFPQVSYFLVGNSGRNGKSTFTKILLNLVGIENVSSCLIDELNIPEKLSLMGGKLLNLGDDIDSTYIENSRGFKSTVTGDLMTKRNLHNDPISFKPFATLVYTCNNMPVFKDKSGGIERRVKIFNIQKPIREEDVRYGLEIILSHPVAKQRLLNIAVEGFREIRKLQARNEKIDFGPIINIESEKYIVSTDPFKKFFVYEAKKYNFKGIYSDCLKYIMSMYEKKEIKTLYAKYVQFAKDEGLTRTYSKNKFTEKVTSSSPIKTYFSQEKEYYGKWQDANSQFISKKNKNENNDKGE